MKHQPNGTDEGRDVASYFENISILITWFYIMYQYNSVTNGGQSKKELDVWIKIDRSSRV